MKYNDYELVYMAKDKNEEAINIIYDKYRPLIEKKARLYYAYSSNKGVELNDFIQEAMIGLEEAINNYDENSNILFYTFVSVCIDRQLKTMLTKINRVKHKILNEAVSLDYMYDDEGNDNNVNMLYFIKEDNNPEQDLIDIETEKELYNKIIKCLRPNEKEIFDLRIKGFNYNEIALKLNKDPKSVTNILYRIKRKIKKIINNE